MLKVLREEIKRLVHGNTVLMMVMGLIVTYLTLNKQGAIMSSEIITLIRLEGLFLLYLWFALEYAKFSLVPDKRTRKLEFLLANGVSIGQIIGFYIISNYVVASFTIVPTYLLLWSHIHGSLTGIAYFFINNLLTSIWIVNTLMCLKNMNSINSLQFYLSILSIVILVFAFLCYFETQSALAFISCKWALTILLIWSFAKPINRERLIESYY